MRGRCNNCSYFNKVDEDGGECRRYPPIVVCGPYDVHKGPITPPRLSYELRTEFPDVQLDQWCGEFKQND